jgi:hypothetical protein
MKAFAQPDADMDQYLRPSDYESNLISANSANRIQYITFLKLKQET